MISHKLFAAVLLGMLLGFCWPFPGLIIFHLQAAENVVDLLNNFEGLYNKKRYEEATDAGLVALGALERQFGRDSVQVGAMLDQLAGLYCLRKRYDDAEPAYKRAIAIYEKAASHSNFSGARISLARTFDSLASLYDDQERYDEAEPLYSRSLEIKGKLLGPDDTEFATTLNNLGTLYSHEARFGDAERLFNRSLTIIVRAVGPDHPDVATVFNNLGRLYGRQGRLAEAESYFTRSLSIDEMRLGPDNPDLTATLDAFAGIYAQNGRYAKAEPLYRRSLEINERAFGPNSIKVASALKNLGSLYAQEARKDEAETFLKRSLAIYEKIDSNEPLIANVWDELASLYGQARYREAEAFLKKSKLFRERVFGPGDMATGRSLNNLALLYYYHGNFTDAEPLYKRSLEIHEKFIAAHPVSVVQYGALLNNIGLLYNAQGRFDEAKAFYERALAMYQKILSPDHKLFIDVLNNLAMLSAATNDWKSSVNYWRQVTQLLIRRTDIGGHGLGEPLTGRSKAETQQWSYMFHGFIKASYRRALEEGYPYSEAAGETFQIAQWIIGSAAAQSVTQMAVRSTATDSTIAALIRERQDLEAEWQSREQLRNMAIAEPVDRTIDRPTYSENLARLTSIEARVLAIDTQLKTALPEYAAFANPEPLPAAEVQARLHENEALVLFLDSNGWFDETYIWVVTKTTVRWVRADLGTAQLTREVTALRCGLDDDEDAWRTPSSRCASLLSLTYEGGSKLPFPFDLIRSHSLYKALFSQIEDVIKDKALLLVLSGPLTQLPFQVLVTAPPAIAFPNTFAGYRDVAWLVRQHAISVFPSVAAWKSIRQIAKSSQAESAYTGFGDPLLDGDPAKYPSEVAAAKKAREARCQLPPEPVVSSIPPAQPHRTVRALDDRGIVDLDFIRRQMPLPETADELCDVAQVLGSYAADVHLGADATEATVKRLSADGKLSQYKIVHFATHGVLANRLSAGSEPGLILTPPNKADDFDDGYLSTSEIVKLKLNADWVILSACNTAAGDAEGAEALSGLARAFFYAGARSLLVSHWAVNSKSTISLIIKAVALSTGGSVGRAEALRQSMLEMIEHGRQYEAHPAFWAPFVLVGEGAPAQ